jgi:DNA-binding NarL/FixJ family response regulator
MTWDGRTLRVLVIEDEPLITMEIEDVIDSMGYKIVGPFSHIDDASAAVQNINFDCAILDVNIRGGNTYVIANILIERRCPFVIASGYSDWSIPDDLFVRKRLTKPYGSSELEAELRLLEAEVIARASSL